MVKLYYDDNKDNLAPPIQVDFFTFYSIVNHYTTPLLPVFAVTQHCAFCLLHKNDIYRYYTMYQKFLILNGYLLLSMVVLNSRNRPENIWLLKGMHLHKQWHKNQNAKNYLNAINTALTKLRYRSTVTSFFHA